MLQYMVRSRGPRVKQSRETMVYMLAYRHIDCCRVYTYALYASLYANVNSFTSRPESVRDVKSRSEMLKSRIYREVTCTRTWRTVVCHSLK